MDLLEQKQQALNQRIGVFLVIFGTLGVWTGCHFHFEALTTISSGTAGAGLNMLTSQIPRNTLNNKPGATINVENAGPAAA